MTTDGPILVVDDDAVSRHVLREALTAEGLTCEAMAGGAAALAWLEVNRPAAVLLDLVMPEPDGFAILRYVRARKHLADVPVVVLTGLDADDEIERVFASGADDYVHKPFRPAELVARVRGQLRLREYVEQLNRRERDAHTVLEMTQALASTLDIRDILFTVVKRVADVVRVDRCSIVLIGDHGNVGFVLATSDDEHVRDLPLDLAKYPEIREVLRTGHTLVIRDSSEHPLFEALRRTEPPLAFCSLALAPIITEERAMGVLFLRSRRSAAFSDHEMALVHTVANATAIALRNARILQTLRDETQQSTFARVEAERRVQLFQRYADFFESAADGMVVIDREGYVLFGNPRAREILGFSETEFMSLQLSELVVESDRAPSARLLRGFAEGVYPRGVDLHVMTSRGDPVIISVSFSSVLHEDNAILFTFRDASHERKTAIELKQTKESLERVIDSSVDGIISADRSGTVVLFNRAASRIFGYSPEQVVGKISVEKLYPAGVARDVMRKIRDPNLSGPGRLEGHRVDMVDARGCPLPVTLSAALIMDGDQVLGSVGIFTDNREKLRMETRLQEAQEELRARERQAIVAELAGTAAHELNQPLTSVIGYAELLRRSVRGDASLENAVGVIIGEAERMAEIVRKIGKITRYETKSYVGEARILDLEKSSGDASDDKGGQR